MSRPIKKTGFRQGIHVISATQKEAIGTRRILRDGREFVYAKAGASALSAGKLAMAADIASAVSNQGMTAASAVGDTQLVYTAGSAVTYAADYFKGGFLLINDAAGEGYQYEIDSSTAVTAGTAITITLVDPIKVALTTSSEGTLVHNPCMATIESADEENMPVGVAPVAVTATYWYWAQCKGLCTVLCSGAVTLFGMVVPGATAGSVKAMPATLDIDMPVIGQAYRAGVDTEYTSVKLNL